MTTSIDGAIEEICMGADGTGQALSIATEDDEAGRTLIRILPACLDTRLLEATE
jgi:hypothetical protein